MATRVAVYFIEAYQARKVQIHKTIYPSKSEGIPAIREMKVEQNGREGREKCFLTFLLQCAKRPCASLSCLKNTIYNVPDGRNAPSPVTGEITH